MAFNPRTYEALAQIQSALLTAEWDRPGAEELLQLMRRGLDALGQFDTIDRVQLRAVSSRWLGAGPAAPQAAEDRRWVTEQIGEVITRWNERRQEPWLED